MASIPFARGLDQARQVLSTACPPAHSAVAPRTIQDETLETEAQNRRLTSAIKSGYIRVLVKQSSEVDPIQRSFEESEASDTGHGQSIDAAGAPPQVQRQPVVAARRSFLTLRVQLSALNSVDQYTGGPSPCC